MATTKATFRQLFVLKHDINKQASASPAFAFFHKGRITRFLNENKNAIAALDRFNDQLVTEYVEHDNGGKPVIIQVNGGSQYKFATQADSDAYEKKMNAFLDREVNIID